MIYKKLNKPISEKGVVRTNGGTTIDAYTKVETDNLLRPKATYTYVDDAIKDVKVDAYTKDETNTLLDRKQNTLIAGDGITITGNVISSDGSGGGGGTVEGATKEYVDALDKENVKLNGNQNIDGEKTFRAWTIFSGKNINYGTLEVYNGRFVINKDSSTYLDSPIIVSTNIVNKKYVDDAIANVNVDTTNLVDKVSDESIDGVKTFIKSPKGPEPRDNDDLATRRYVVNTIGSFKVDAYTRAESDSIVSNILDGTTPHTKIMVNDIEISTKNSFGYFGNTSRNMVWRAAEHRFTNKQLKEVANPVDNTDATNKQYVDTELAKKQNSISGININNTPTLASKDFESAEYISNSFQVAWPDLPPQTNGNSAGVLKVYSFGANRCVQDWIPRDDDKRYTRRKTDTSVWTNWTQI